MILSAFITGLRRATRNWKMITMLVIASIIFALPVAVLVFVVVLSTSSGTHAAAQLMSDNVDPIWLMDLFNNQFPGDSLASFVLEGGVIFLVMAFLYQLANAFFAGGIIEVLTTPRGVPFLMRTFWAGAGSYFGRFVRLWLISLAGYSAFFIIYSLALAWIGSSSKLATEEGPVVFAKWSVTLVLFAGFAVVNLIFDYARIGTVRNGSRRMFRETGRAVKFVVRHFLSTATVYLMIAVIAVVTVFVLAYVRNKIPQSGVMLTFQALLIGQVAIASRMWSKIAFYASELESIYTITLNHASSWFRPFIAPFPSSPQRFIRSRRPKSQHPLKCPLQRKVRMMRILRSVFRLLLVAFFVFAGVNHFRNPGFYLRMMPPYLPWHAALNYISGFLEILLGLMVLVPSWRKLAGWGLIALLIAVFPANLHMALNADQFPDLPASAYYIRLPFQLLFIAWVYWTCLTRAALGRDRPRSLGV